MSADVAFDTRKEFKRFAESGSFDDAQADLLVDHSREVLTGLATKEDLHNEVKVVDMKIDHVVAALDRVQADIARLSESVAGLSESVARTNAEAADRIATATERMASSRWWQTAILIAVVALVGAVVTGLPVLPEIVSALAGG